MPYRFEGYNMNNKKIKVIVSSLILSLGLTGCSFSLIKDSNEDKLFVKYDEELEFENDNNIDQAINIDKEKIKKVDYEYLIEASEYTKPTFAHVIDESDLTSKIKGFDRFKEKNYETFNESIFQPITLPIAFTLFNIDDIGDLTEAYGDCDINYKKLYTIDGEILYYFDSTFTFNSFAERYIGLDIKENDTMNAKILYRLEEDDSLTILYKNQTGIKDNCNNVLEKNFNNSKKIVIPIEETVFNSLDGEYDEEYLLEALDVYNGTNDYNNESNEGKDFSSFKR